MSSLLALTWYEDGVEPSEPVVSCGTCEMRQKLVQNAGQAFWDKYELPLCSKKRSGQSKDADVEQDEREETERERAFRERKEKRDREQKSKDGGLLKMSDDLKGRDLYELLEVEPSASAEDLKKSYRKLVLQYHPDKMTDPTEEQKKHFLLLQEAFEIVSDPSKRRRYESTLSFDDTIPTDFHKEKDLDFFEVFRPVFKRNSRWSARSRVPDLGDSSTSIEAVKKFYDWWHDFESWRDPLAMAEQEDYELHCLEQAECREERRWMERENAKVAKKLKQAERDRIAELVNYAEKHDPRMVAHREQVRAQKEEEKARKAAAKEAERQKIEEEERARKAEQDAIRKAEEEKRLAEKKIKEEQRNALKAARQRVKNLHRNAEPVFRRAVHSDQLQALCLTLGMEELDELAIELESALAKGGAGVFDEAVELLHAEIRKTGVTPVEDATVRADGDSQSTCSGDDESVESEPRELTPEELAAEQKRKAAAEAAEAERREKKAEELRKKREQQKKEDMKQQQAMQKEESKARKAEQKAQKKAEEKVAAEQRKGEEQRQKQLQQREEQRLAALKEEEERKRLHQEALVARAFEVDRNARLSILEKDDLGLGDAAAAGDFVGLIRTTFLTESAGPEAAQLRLAFRRIAVNLPSADVIKPDCKVPDPKAQGKKAEAERKRYEEAKAAADTAEQSRREEEEFFIDLALACVTQTEDKAMPDARRAFRDALAVALRPPQNSPELSKDAKSRIKKQRLRIRMAVLRLMRQLLSEEPVEGASIAQAEAEQAAPADTREASPPIADGVSLVVTEEGPIFESPSSYTTIGTATIGSTLTAAGAPVDVDGYGMVPLRPRGTVEVRIVKAVAPQASAKKNSKGGKKTKGGNSSAKPSEEKAPPKELELPGKLKELVRIAAGGAGSEAADGELLQAYLGGFDPAAAATEESAQVEAEAQPEKAEKPQEEAPAAAAAAPADSKSSKKGKKAGKEQAAGEEDLDALLSEFGVVTTGKKKKGKK